MEGVAPQPYPSCSTHSDEQQASGTDAVVLYSARILEKAGLRNDSDKLLATVGVGISKLVFTLVATSLVGPDRAEGIAPHELCRCRRVATGPRLRLARHRSLRRSRADVGHGICVANVVVVHRIFLDRDGPHRVGV